MGRSLAYNIPGVLTDGLEPATKGKLYKAEEKIKQLKEQIRD